MATIQQFEDLEVWKLARELAKDVYAASSVGAFARDYDLRSQIRRSSGSVMDNIAEGFERSGRAEFLQFVAIAKGSVGETRSQLYRALDQAYIDQTTFDDLFLKARRISQMLNRLMAHLKETEVKGWKYQNPNVKP